MPLTGIKQVISLSRDLHWRLRELVDSARCQQRLHLCIFPAQPVTDFTSVTEELSDVKLSLRPGAREKNKAPPPTGLSTLLASIRSCIISRDLRRAKEVHLECIRSAEDSNRYVANNLINMYIKCGSLVDAQKLFDNLKHRDVVGWNSLMVAYIEKGDNERALEMFSRMIAAEAAEDEGGCCSPSVRSFVAALQACTNMAALEDRRLIGGKLVRRRALEMGMYIHSQAVKRLRHGWDIFLSTTLVDMYSKCGSLADACKVFDKMPCHNVVSWTALMLGYCENGEEELALELFSRIQPKEGWAPNYRTFIAALKACTGLAQKEEWKQVDGRLLKAESLRRGVEIHELAKKRGFDGEMFLASTLVDMYSKCGSTADAREVFDKMPRHDLVSWTGMLLGYAENGQEELALDFFSLLRRENFSPDAVACVAALRACVSLAMKEESREVNGSFLKVVALEKGIEIHAQAVSSKCELETSVASTLIDMYSKCGVLEDGKRVFDRVVFKDVLLWNSLMQAYAENGEGQLALEAFVLKPEGCSPNGLSFVAAAKACISLATREEATPVHGQFLKLEALEKGIVIHSKAVQLAFDSDLLLGNTFIDMYNKCGSPGDARVAFDRMACHNVFSWNGLILGWSENGEPELAMELFEFMQSSGACQPNFLSFVAALKACTSLAAEEEGQQVQQQAVKVKALEKGMGIHSRALANNSPELELELFLANTLVDFYAKSGSMFDARRVFDCMPHHTVVSWTALLLGYSESSEPELALEMFYRMRDECLCSPDALTLVSVLKACASLAAAPATRAIHRELCRANWIERDELVITTLLDAYGKCGSLSGAQQVFDGLKKRDRVSYTALLAGYSRDGDANRVLELYRGLIEDGVKPNDVTFICLLNSCSHAGLVDMGRSLFKEMVEQHGINPGIEHYSCMLDLLGRANKLEEAVRLVKEMKIRANVVVWKTLLAASKAWKNSVIGNIAFQKLLEIEDNDPAAYVLMASIYESNTNIKT